MSAPDPRWTMDEMFTLAARGLGRVDRDGLRGATLVPMEEIAAMAGTLAVLGLIPIEPGGAVPTQPLLTEKKDD